MGFHRKSKEATLIYLQKKLIIEKFIFYPNICEDVVKSLFSTFKQVYIIALLLAAIIFKTFNLPVFVDKDNLYGICLLLLLFGFSSTHMVHLCEKLFNDASLANMYILCLNIMLGLCTAMTIILFDVLGESDVSRITSSSLFIESLP